MLLSIIIVYQLSLAAAGSVYPPFVYLLDVGNEELDKTNTEQFRVSLPGGSLALRYPAIGYGDQISHVRVSAIDFGAKLKADIVEGGPGFTYVVLTLSGQPGIPFDTVVTLQTTALGDGNWKHQDNEVSLNRDSTDPYGVEQDANDSAEDTSDEDEQYSDKMNAELAQSSSNVYSKYIENQEVDCAENCSGDNDNSDTYPNKDIHKPIEDNLSDNQEELEKDYADETDSIGNRAENDYNEEKQSVTVDRNVYNIYKALTSHLNNNNEYDKQRDNDELYNEIGGSQVFNDEEVNHNGEVIDTNNNSNFDDDDTSAVDY